MTEREEWVADTEGNLTRSGERVKPPTDEFGRDDPASLEREQRRRVRQARRKKLKKPQAAAAKPQAAAAIAAEKPKRAKRPPEPPKGPPEPAGSPDGDGADPARRPPGGPFWRR